ncbi:MAG TPA: beta-lactamase family protein [Candidatus Agathobaculum pullistercoris]|nr:serine hydrolase domain-containing protein [uncultured Agathobaculum sp.]HIX10655.1 beta-lactamase family protein [Candidatus Agathobaculum pullistercoris]
MNKHLSRLLAGALATALVLPGAAFAAELPQTDLLVPAALSPVTPAPDSHSSDPLARSAQPTAQTALTVDERVQLLLDAGAGITSIQYAMMDSGEIVESGVGGVYSKQENRLLTTENLFGIGSTSKMFTTAAMMRLADQGKVDLDRPVTDYIPEFTMADARYKDITVRMLLNHSSGLMGSTYGNGFLFDDADTQAHDTLLADLATQTLKADPGAFSVYCNDGFTLAEIVIERVSGMSFTDFIHQEITGPLSMAHTKTMQDDFDRSSIVRTYNPYAPDQETPTDAVNIIGTGGVYATAEDLCRFAQIFTGEADVLTDASREATFHKEYADGQWLDVENNTVGYGLGWDSVDLYPFNLYGIQAVTKGGDTLLMHNSLIVLPEYGLSAAVSSSGGSSAYCQMLATSLLLDQLEEKGIITERLSALDSFTPAEQTALDADMKQYEGLYGDSTSLMRLTMDDAGTLTLTNAYAPTQAQTYIYCGNGLFKHETGALELRFIEQNGRTYLTYRGYSAIDGLCDVVSETYYLEKLPENAVTDEMQAAWAAREGKAYVSVTDKASSQLYMSGLPMLGIGTVDGYLLSNPLTSGSRADVAIQIPMMGGRDTSPFVFETIDGAEYVHYTDGLYMDISAVPDIYTGTQSHLTIQPNGYNRWYNLPEVLDGKTMSIQGSESTGFVVFNAAGQTVNQSAVTGDTQVILPGGGAIVFCGDAGDRINLTIS